MKQTNENRKTTKSDENQTKPENDETADRTETHKANPKKMIKMQKRNTSVDDRTGTEPPGNAVNEIHSNSMKPPTSVWPLCYRSFSCENEEGGITARLR